MFTRDALAVARETGCNVVVVGLAGRATDRPAEGGTAAEKLASLLDNEWLRRSCAWGLENGVYRPEQLPVRSANHPLVSRARRNLESLLPSGYRSFLALDPRQQLLAAGAPWARLWRSLSEEQRQPGPPIPLAELSSERQALILSGLQSQIVLWFLKGIASSQAVRLDAASLLIDFGVAAMPQEARRGYARILRLREGSRTCSTAPSTASRPCFACSPAPIP